LSISVDITDDECNAACGGQEGCPKDAAKHCKCGDEAMDPEMLSKAAEATAARETTANEAQAKARSTRVREQADAVAANAGLPSNGTLDVSAQDQSDGCPELSSITGDDLRCMFPMLDAGRAAMYATAASSKMGTVLGTACAWAAFLGNAAIESKELTMWKEIECATQPPFCGRGPLQITSQKNYEFCSQHPICDCNNIVDDIEAPAMNAEVGFGTAACVWAGMFGYSLSQLADGSREGFLRTCCVIHQGHYPCRDMEQYERREQYWRTASSCLGSTTEKTEAVPEGSQSSEWSDSRQKVGGWAPSDTPWS
jgi:hypothetical protein